jgi:dihydroorotase
MKDARFGSLADAPATVVLVGGRVVDPSAGTDEIRDLAVRDGRIVDEVPEWSERIDARGLVVAPGLCDVHAHLRTPGDAAVETVLTGSRAAARGGYTTVCAMPNTDPPIDTAAAVQAPTPADAACRVRVIGAATAGRGGHAPSELAAMAAAGAVGFSDDGTAVGAEVADDILAILAKLGLPLIEHAEDAVLASGTVMRDGPTATRLGLVGWPARAELAVVERDLALAAATGAPLHFTHLSTASALEVVRAARAGGMAVTCDVTPHHLAMTDEWVAGSRRFSWEEPEADESRAFDGTCRVNPPLAPREDALALLAGVADGTVDAIATDHAPHPLERKLVPFDEAAPGLIGLETALSLGLAAVEAGRLALPELVAAMSARPAAIIGEKRGLGVGEMADLVAFEPGARWTVEAHGLASRSANTPLVGMELPGVVRLTVAGGRVTYRS